MSTGVRGSASANTGVEGQRLSEAQALPLEQDLHRAHQIPFWYTPVWPYTTDGAITPHLPYLIERQCLCIRL